MDKQEVINNLKCAIKIVEEHRNNDIKQFILEFNDKLFIINIDNFDINKRGEYYNRFGK